jgi:hypothetical protein
LGIDREGPLAIDDLVPVLPIVAARETATTPIEFGIEVEI